MWLGLEVSLWVWEVQWPHQVASREESVVLSTIFLEKRLLKEKIDLLATWRAGSCLDSVKLRWIVACLISNPSNCFMLWLMRLKYQTPRRLQQLLNSFWVILLILAVSLLWLAFLLCIRYKLLIPIMSYIWEPFYLPFLGNPRYEPYPKLKVFSGKSLTSHRV